MANSFVSVRAVEGQTDFPFNFPNGYLTEDTIHVYVDGVEVARTISGGVAIIAPATAGQEVVVARHSPQTPVITFDDGSILNKQNIDVQNRHAFMLAEEAAEQRDFFALGDIDMNYHKIIHVASGTDPYDVVNKGQFDYFLTINEDAAQRAEQAADEAAASAQLAGSHASTAQGASAAAEAYAEFAQDTVEGFDAHAETKKAEVTAEGNTQIARVIAEGDIQHGRAKVEADRAQGYAEILERPYEDMGAHQIQQGYPPVPSFSSMWTVIDGGIDPIDGVTQWNVGDVLVYSVQTVTWTRLAGSLLSGGGDPLPVEILDDLIMQQGKKIRFRIDEFIDTVGMTLDSSGDVVVGEIPTSPNTGTPAPKIGFAATELYHVVGTDATGLAIKHRIYDAGYKPTAADVGAVSKSGDTMGGNLIIAHSTPTLSLNASGGTQGRITSTPDTNEVKVINDTTGQVLNIGTRVTTTAEVQSGGINALGWIVSTDDRAARRAAITACDGSNPRLMLVDDDAAIAGKFGLDLVSGVVTVGKGDPAQATTTYYSDHLRTNKQTRGYSDRAFTQKSAPVNFGGGNNATYGFVAEGVAASINFQQLVGTIDGQYHYGRYELNHDGIFDWWDFRSGGHFHASGSIFQNGNLLVANQADVDENKPRSHGDGGGGTYIGIAAPGKLMCTVILLHGGKWYPLTFPIFNATQAWIRNHGGESADRDYDFGVAVTYDGYTLGISAIQGSNAPGLPALGQVICW